MPPTTTETITAMMSEACTRVAAARPPISAAAITSRAQPNWTGRMAGARRPGSACDGRGSSLAHLGKWVRRNVTSWGPDLTSAAEQIKPAITWVPRVALSHPIGGSMHTWYCPAGTFAANSRAEFRDPDATVASVPLCSTFTGLPETLSTSLPSWTTLTVSLTAGPLVAAELALGLGVVPDPCPGAVVGAWPVKPPMTSTATNAVACANNGTASFLRSSMTT